MDLFVGQLVNALVIGIVYALIAVGLSVVFGVLKLVNFAHGELYMAGGFIYYFVSHSLGLPSLVGLAVTGLAAFLGGWLIERAFIAPVHQGKVERPDEYVILVTFALSIFLQNLAFALFGPRNRQPPALFDQSLAVGPIYLGPDRLTALVVGVFLLLGLLALLHRTFIGKALRAVSQHREGAALVGIPASSMGALAFGLGAGLAGLAGALVGPIFLVHPTMGILPALKGFVIVVLGGMGSVPGSIVGAFALAFAESLGSAYLPDPTRALAYKDAFGLVMLVAVLLLRPYGLFGERVREA